LRELKDTKAEKASRYRRSAAEALDAIAQDGDQVDTALIESLEYPGWQGPFGSIRALDAFGPKAAAAIPHLQRLQESKDDLVKDAAIKALARIREAS
jgi:hypothetical protein